MIRLCTVEHILWYMNQLDEEICQIMFRAKDPLGELLRSLVMTSFFDLYLCVNGVLGSTYRADGDLGGFHFDFRIFKIIEDECEKKEKGTWSRLRMPERIERVLRNVAESRAEHKVGSTFSEPIILKMPQENVGNGRYVRKYLQKDEDWRKSNLADSVDPPVVEVKEKPKKKRSPIRKLTLKYDPDWKKRKEAPLSDVVIRNLAEAMTSQKTERDVRVTLCAVVAAIVKKSTMDLKDMEEMSHDEMRKLFERHIRVDAQIQEVLDNQDARNAGTGNWKHQMSRNRMSLPTIIPVIAISLVIMRIVTMGMT